MPNTAICRSVKAIIFIAACALSTWTSAHTGVESQIHHRFLAGFFHPLLGIDHMAAMLAVGIWSALSARRAGRALLWAPLGFANLLMVGAMLGLQGVVVPAVEPMIALSLLVFGLLVVSRLHLSGLGSALLAGVFALFHGLAHGGELAHSSSAFETLAGMLSATVLLHVAGLALGWRLRHASGLLVRTAGGAVAAFGGSLALLQLS